MSSGSPNSSSLSTGSSSSTGLDAVTQLRENIQSSPLLQFNGLTNGSWFSFAIIAIAASRLGTVGPKVGLPLITAYMIVGVICGPYALNLVTTTELPDLAYITQIALSFIAFSAGSELYLPELRSLFKKIAYIAAFNAIYTYTICALFIYALAAGGLVSWLTPYIGSCAAGICLLAASIMVARSPASAIAVVRELRAKGPITSTMLGVTVVGDVIVLVLFTISSSIALAQCSGSGFDGGLFIVTIITLIAAVGIGYVLGGLLIFLLWASYARYLILPTGFFIFVLSDWFAVYSITNYGVSINFDSLLICITAGYVATNQSKNRIAFLRLLGSAAPVIFIPFFTKVGVELNLLVLVNSLLFAFCVFCMRAFCVFLGSGTGGYLTGMKKNEKFFMWMTMLAQAGVSLGLASEVAVKFPAWGRNFQTTIIAVVLINQFVGPVACKYALKTIFKEAGQMKEGEGEHGHEGGGPHAKVPTKVKRVVIVGVDLISLGVAQRLLDRGYAVTLLDTDKKKLLLAKALTTLTEDIIHTPKQHAADREDEQEAESSNDPSSAVHLPGDEAEEEEEAVAQSTPTSSIAGRRKGRYNEVVSTSLPNDPLSRQTSDLVEEESQSTSIEMERTIETDLGGGAEEEEEDGNEEAAGSFVDSSIILEKRIVTILIPTGDGASPVPDSCINLLGPLLSSTHSQLFSAMIHLSSDQDSFTLASHLISSFHLPAVLVRLYHPDWTPACSQAGIIPVVDSAVISHVCLRALMENEEMEIVEVEKVKQLTSHPAVLASFIDLTHDTTLLNWCMSKEDRQAWNAEHPPPPMSMYNMPDVSLSSLQSALTSTVSVNTVPAALREDYVTRIHELSNATHEGDMAAEIHEANQAFLSPGMSSEMAKGK